MSLRQQNSQFDVFRTMFTLLFSQLSFPLTAAFYFRDQATRKKKKIVKRLNKMLMNDLEDVKQEDFNRFILVQKQRYEDKKNRKKMTALKQTRAQLLRLNLLALRRHSRMNAKICRVRKKLLRNVRSKEIMTRVSKEANTEAIEIDQFIQKT